MNRRPGPNAAPFHTRAHKPGHREEVNPYRDVVGQFGRELIPSETASERRARWAEEFGRAAPITLELGTGNGSWLAAASASAPGEHFIGLEIRYKRCVQTAEKLRAAGLGNGRVVRWSWFELAALFAPGELHRIVIHHPDPWSNPSKAKHRLIRGEFLAEAAALVHPGGELRLKTDFLPHRDALLAGVAGTPWVVEGTSDDVRGAGAPWPDDVVTGYQAKFDRAGLPVYAARLSRR
jgi:tRNA (guanine-N7-)-methyltransferase